jgi:N-acetylglucosaminyldiphosphoundecaprenol N-acetyl-beta-D-mannosaminyltransferase
LSVPIGVEGSGRLPTVQVGSFDVIDLDTKTLVPTIVGRAFATRGVKPYIASPYHVGSLTLMGQEPYRKALNATDAVYADGISVVFLARIAGAQRIERASTTDIGWKLLEETTLRLGRPPRVAIVGGRDDLSARAGVALSNQLKLDVVYTTHGFHADWTPVMADLTRSEPDVLLVGLGQPLENVWCHTQRPKLPPCLVLTCGGWLGFITGDEKRAPRWMQRLGLEWIFRLAHAPTRLIRRYAHGAGRTLILVPTAFRIRRNTRDQQ